MKPLTPYLFFDGNCREAMDFYKDCFGGKLEVSTFSEAPPGAFPGDAEKIKDKIMHSSLCEGDFVLMASDSGMGAPKAGDNVSLSIQCESPSQADDLFKALGEGGKVLMPMADTFWDAYFGVLIDRFGIHWMLHYQKAE